MRARSHAPLVSDRLLIVDALTIAVVSAAIGLVADRLLLMSILVPGLLAARLLLWARAPRPERGWSWGWEVMLLGVGVALGGGNDWLSVVHHRIYDYNVPVFAPEISTIPFWMLLYWGMILRFLVSLTRWWRWTPPMPPTNEIWIGRRRVVPAWIKVGLQLALVFGTRQCIYRTFGDPIWSWVPFALALGFYGLVFRPGRRVRKVLGLVLVGGPLVEVLYIQVAGLHAYQHGWLGGVPVWIVLWWVLAVAILDDLAGRALRWIPAREDPPGVVAPAG